MQFPQGDLDDLQRRVRETRWPEQETVGDASQGVQLTVLKALADRWVSGYDWRAVEARLNELPQFVTEIDGLDIHFIHVRSPHPDALPMIVTHGWPGSIIEQLKIVGPLTDPTTYGGSAAHAFDLVIPSLPGHGFSGKPTEPGWDPIRIAKAWIELMKRLGYDRYVAQGGDWGNAVTEQMALLEPAGLVGIHTNMPATVPDSIQDALTNGEAPPADLSPDERGAWDQLAFFYAHGLAYAQEMGNRPQTLYGIADSPVGLAAWMLDHDAASYELIARVFAGAVRGPHGRRHPRQRDAVLAYQYGCLLGPVVLGEQARILRPEGCHTAGRRQRLPRRDLRRTAKLDDRGVSEPHPFQPARSGRALRRMGAARAVLTGDARRLPVAAVRHEVTP